MTFNLGINASRARSGGAVAHLIGLIQEARPQDHGIEQVHVWSYSKLLAKLPSQTWLVKHITSSLEGSLLRQLWWERFYLPEELRQSKCAILLNVDAGSVCRFGPAVTMSRDMLSYESREINRYSFGKDRLRLITLRYIQNMALRSAVGVIFLTRYAAHVIQQSCGSLKNVAYVPHGVGMAFHADLQKKASLAEAPVRCMYISNAMPYKHQWHVVEAIAILRQRGYELRLELVGGGEGEAQARLDAAIATCDPDRKFVTQYDFIPHSSLPKFLAAAHIFIFASSCENMPNTLVEAMASGLPIACSNRGPMPEVLEDGGVYFDPENPKSIADVVAELVDDPDKRIRLANRASQLATQYSWKRCADETLSFIARTNNQHYKVTS
jgi:glycosyltransferase involved in cell wall biosynthesis